MVYTSLYSGVLGRYETGDIVNFLSVAHRGTGIFSELPVNLERIEKDTKPLVQPAAFLLSLEAQVRQ